MDLILSLLTGMLLIALWKHDAELCKYLAAAVVVGSVFRAIFRGRIMK